MDARLFELIQDVQKLLDQLTQRYPHTHEMDIYVRGVRKLRILADKHQAALKPTTAAYYRKLLKDLLKENPDLDISN